MNQEVWVLIMNIFPIIFFIRVGGRGYGEGPKKTKQKKKSASICL